ncbi:MAG TPA: hypothetical protein GXX70_03485 [Tepidimicrobium sp.]|nr:hypothetical protein [Tepidimicrobium sp.]
MKGGEFAGLDINQEKMANNKSRKNVNRSKKGNKDKSQQRNENKRDNG